MKLIIAIVSNDDTTAVNTALNNAGYYTTKFSTTGGFLKAGNTSILIGTEEEKVDKAIEIIKEKSQTRVEVVPTSIMGSAIPMEVKVGGATIFVLDVEQFIKA